MRLIDADAMMETLKRKYPQWYTGKPKDNLMYYAWLVYYWAVKEAPTIDAVPVVRCKDCRWRNTIGCDVYVAAVAAQSVYACEDDGFCKWAGRKEDD